MNTYRPNILVADNDARSRQDLCAFFAQKGWDCNIVSDAEAFDKELGAGAEYDLVIADPDLPGLDLKSLVRDIFKKKPSQALVVVGASPKNQAEMQYIHNGITDFLTKPVDFSLIERCIEQAVRLRDQEERERMTLRFIKSEKTEMRFTCRELADVQALPLPILNRLVQSSRLSSYEGLKMRLAIQEAILNAVEHGNLELESKWKEEFGDDGRDKFSEIRKERLSDPMYSERLVQLSSWFDGECLEITVKDEGNGFLGSDTFVPDLSQNLSCFGRGMTLINDAVDELRYAEGGSEVTLVKRLNGSGG